MKWTLKAPAAPHQLLFWRKHGQPKTARLIWTINFDGDTFVDDPRYMGATRSYVRPADLGGEWSDEPITDFASVLKQLDNPPAEPDPIPKGMEPAITPPGGPSGGPSTPPPAATPPGTSVPAAPAASTSAPGQTPSAGSPEAHPHPSTPPQQG